MTGPTAIVVGAEHPGLSQRWLDNAHLPIKLPMFGQANSLNVATAATALLYEAIRQRQAALPQDSKVSKNSGTQPNSGRPPFVLLELKL